MRVVPVRIVAAIGAVAFCLMAASFVMVLRGGGWQRAMQFTPEGSWPLPRRLMMAGAVLGTLFGLSYVVLSLIPGGIPWLN
jgi:hypothetical protein